MKREEVICDLNFLSYREERLENLSIEKREKVICGLNSSLLWRSQIISLGNLGPSATRNDFRLFLNKFSNLWLFLLGNRFLRAICGYFS